MVIQLNVCILYNVPFDNISLIWSHHEGLWSRKNQKEIEGVGEILFSIYSKIRYKFALKNDTSIKTNFYYLTIYKKIGVNLTFEIIIKQVGFFNCQITLQFAFIVDEIVVFIRDGKVWFENKTSFIMKL